jgi:hypothetical protein
MTTLNDTIESCTQGHINQEQPFMIAGIVREGMSAQFEASTNIANSQNKLFILCACQSINSPFKNILYMTNDPNDFIYNKTSVALNRGVVPIRKKDANFFIDLTGINHSATIGLPSKTKFTADNTNLELNDLNFTQIKGGESPDSLNLNYGIAYKIDYNNNGLNNDDRLNFSVRKNVSSSDFGRLGPSIAYFSEGIFEALKTVSYASYGTDFTFEADKNNLFGMSQLILESNSASFTSIPISNNSGIIKFTQGTSVWFDTFDKNTASGNVNLGPSGGQFLNTTVYNPDISEGISVLVNLRNSEENFITISDITTPGVSEIFDYYLVNLTGYTSGGLENNSSQYFNKDSSDIIGGICYYLSNKYTFYNFFHQENKKGFIADINCINGTPIDRTTTNTDLLTVAHAGPNTNYSTFNDANFAIDLNKFNSYDSNTPCGKNRALGTNCVLNSNSHVAAKDPTNKNIFSNNPKEGQKTFLIEVITLGVLFLAYIVFAFYYFNLSLNSEKK